LSCHPTHPESGPAPNVSDEEREKNWADFKKADSVDPRAIRRQHKWKVGHEPDYMEPDSGWVYQKIEFTGEESEPDQLHLLHGGPPSGLPCERCNTETNVVGETTMWEIYTQPGVEIANMDTIDEARRQELREMRVVILACPECKLKIQFLEEFIPKGLGHG